MQAYDYKRHTPLEHGMIRLFKLLPGRATSELKGNLVARRLTKTASSHFEFDCLETYDALSYTWGSLDRTTDTIQMLVDSEEYFIGIHDNLSLALRQLRKETPTYWWIDALCIHQDDVAEKNVQLQLMPTVYGTAREVVIWLGGEYENSSSALSFLQASLHASSFDDFIKQPGRGDEFLGVVRLMKRPWFTRRWVIQEIACARQAHLHCGDANMPWHVFVDAIYQLAAQKTSLSKVFSLPLAIDPSDFENLSSLSTPKFLHVVDSMLRKTVDGKISEHLMTLEALLASTPQFETSNPQDTVYALLYLAKDAEATSYEDWLARFRRHHKSAVQISPALLDSEKEATGTIKQQIHPEENDCISHEQSQKRRRVNTGADTYSKATQERPLPQSDLRSVHRLGYALVRYLGLEGLGNKRAIMVDYKKDMLEICRDIMKFVMTHSKSIDILCRPWAPNGLNLPTWVRTKADSPHLPGLNGIYRRVNADPLVGDPMWPIKPYRASSGTEASWVQHGRSLHNLMLRGFVLDSIKAKEAPAIAGIIPTSWTTMGDWHNLDTAPPESFWRTLVANRNAAGRRAPYFWGQMCLNAFTRRLPGQDLDTGEAIRYDCPEAVRTFLERVQCVVWTRRLVRFGRTDALGLTAKAAKKGDLLCILQGCSVPVVLREFIDGKPVGRSDPLGHFTVRDTHEDIIDQSRVHYEFIGEAYVHGMMDGEAYTSNVTPDPLPRSFRVQ